MQGKIVTRIRDYAKLHLHGIIAINNTNRRGTMLRAQIHYGA